MPKRLSICPRRVFMAVCFAAVMELLGAIQTRKPGVSGKSTAFSNRETALGTKELVGSQPMTSLASAGVAHSRQKRRRRFIGASDVRTSSQAQEQIRLPQSPSPCSHSQKYPALENRNRVGGRTQIDLLEESQDST